jgi:hypothetical protein
MIWFRSARDVLVSARAGLVGKSFWVNVSLAVSRRELPADKDPRQPVDGLLPSRRATSAQRGNPLRLAGSW